jgi:Phage integrase, N-terminal SAM-like domain
MAKKRGNGEESIHKRPNGNWEVQVSLEGRRLSRAFKTRSECLEWLKKTLNQIDDGMTSASTKVSVGEYLSSWLTSYKTYLRQSSWIYYYQLYRPCITPGIGHIKIKDIKTENV